MWHFYKSINTNLSIQLSQRLGVKSVDCYNASIIGKNTGLYIGGLPSNYTIYRTEEDSRARVCFSAYNYAYYI